MDTDQTTYDPVQIRRLRRHAGLRQTHLADQVGISRAHMCNIEKGKVKSPSPKILAAIARELGCTLDDLGYRP